MVLALGMVHGGCVPTCRATCDKTLRCGNLDSERVALAECVDMCQRQDVLYQQWQDEEKSEAFDDHRRCVSSTSCDDIAEGECYDPLLWVYDDELESTL
jgi:hypothetical protein